MSGGDTDKLCTVLLKTAVFFVEVKSSGMVEVSHSGLLFVSVFLQLPGHRLNHP